MKDATRIDIDLENFHLEFNWSNKHWENHYLELSQIDNEIYYQDVTKLNEDWIPIIRIATRKDPEQYALLYLKHDEMHIAFVAKLLITYGCNSVIFI
jgi:hypothetical protein